MNILVAHLFSVPCNMSLPFPLKDSEFNMPPKRPQTNAGRAAARPASPGNGSHPVSSGSGASQPASSAGSCSQPATVSTTHQTPPEDFDLEDLRARVRRLGRFPNRIMNPQTEAEQEENELWSDLWHQKSLGMPDEDWNSLYRYRDYQAGAKQRYVDAREAVIDDVEALVKKFRRFPKRSHPGTKVSFSQTEENNLTKRLQRVKSHFDDDQQMRFIAVQEQCDAAIQDEKRVMWRMLLDDLSQFVRDSRRLPSTDRKGRQSSTFKEELLAERLAKTTKEFDEAHLTELRNLQKDADQKTVEDLVQEVTQLGYWLHSPFTKVSTADPDYRPSNRVCRA